jgi:hypothetical protein
MPDGQHQISSEYYGLARHGKTFCEIYSVDDAGIRTMHRILEDQDAYDHWHLAQYVKEALEYDRLRDHLEDVELADIPRKEKNLFLFEIFRHFDFTLSYLEFGSSVFEVIDGLSFVAALMKERWDPTRVTFTGVEISGILRQAAMRLHPGYEIRHLDRPSNEETDVLYDRAVSSYLFSGVSELAGAMNRSRIVFSNLFLSTTVTFDEVNATGKTVTYFSLPVLLSQLDKPLYYLFGRTEDDKIEAFFLCCSPSDFIELRDAFYRNPWLRDFLDTKNSTMEPARYLVSSEEADLSRMRERALRESFQLRCDELEIALAQISDESIRSGTGQ